MYYKSSSYERHLLENFDIFGIGINIRFNKQEQHKTRVGGIVTLIMVGLLAYQLNIVIDNQLDTTNPIVLQEQGYTSEPMRYNLTSDKFMMSFGLQNSTSHHYIDPTIYNLTLAIKQTMKTLNPTTLAYNVSTSIRAIKIEPCTADHFTIPAVNQYFLSLTYSAMYCISKEETELFLQGEFDALHFSSLELTVNSCTGTNCNPNMSSLLEYCRLAVYYVDYAVIPSSKSEPFQPLGRQSFWISGPEFTKQTNINFRNTYLNSDYGLVGKTIEQTNILTFSNDKESVSPKSGSLLYDCFIQFDKNINNNYYRSYQKLDRSISQMGGIFNIIFTLGVIICRPLSQIELNLKLINSLFNFEDSQDQRDINNKSENLKKERQDCSKLNLKDNSQYRESLTQQAEQIINSQDTQQKEAIKADFKAQLNQKANKTSQIQKSEGDEAISSRIKQLTQSMQPYMKRGITSNLKEISTAINQSTQKLSKHLAFQSNEREKQENELKSFFNFTPNKISFSGWDYYLNLIKFSNICRGRRNKLLQKGVEKLYNQIDIFYLIQKLLEVEKLKRLLLNENQIKLFEFIPKPILQMEDKKATHVSEKIGILHQEETDLIQKTNDAQQAFSNIVSSNEKPSKIDLRILELLDPHFKLFLQEIGDTQDISTLQKPSTTLFQQYEQNTQGLSKDFSVQNLVYDNTQVATETYPMRYGPSSMSISPRRTLTGLYNSTTKSNQKNQFNF